MKAAVFDRCLNWRGKGLMSKLFRDCCAIPRTYYANNKILPLCALLCCCRLSSTHLQSIFFSYSLHFFPLLNLDDNWAPVSCSRRTVSFTGVLLGPFLLMKPCRHMTKRTNFLNFKRTAEYKATLCIRICS